MFRNILGMALVALTVKADPSFDADSLVLTDAPCQIDLISSKADTSLKVSRDLDSALKRASLENKFVLVFVVGAHGCPWSEKLLFDVVYKPEFYKEAQKSFILTKIEIDQLSGMGKELGMDHPVDKIPMILCLTKDGNMIAEQITIPESPKDVMNYLNNVVDAHMKMDLVLKNKQRYLMMN